jgi:hypothetical protein
MVSTIGTDLGNVIAGYRDKDTTRCAAGLVDAVERVKALEAENESLRLALETNAQESMLWKARLLDRIARLEAALADSRGHVQ